MNYQNKPELIDKLAAEYVLGTLRHKARKKFERWIINDAHVRYAVEAWQNKLHPLVNHIRPITPPTRVWQSIESRLFQRVPSTGWKKLTFWQILSGLGLATSLALSIYIINQVPSLQPTTSNDYVAILSTSEHEPSIVINYDRSKHQLLLTQLHPHPLPSQKTLELWSITEQGTPVSLGILPNQKTMAVSLQTAQLNLLQRTKAVAVSLEPKGGSPTGTPTGAVLYSGKFIGHLSMAPASQKLSPT